MDNISWINYLLDSAGPVLSLWLQLSLLLNGLEIIRDKNIRKLSIIPFITIFVNCTIWVFYGSLRHQYSIIVSNAIGIIVGIISTISFLFFSMYPAPPFYFAIGFVIILIASIFAFLNNAEVVGLISVCLSILVYGSPLSTIQTVIIEKSTRSMPLDVSLAAFLSSFSWTLYGWFRVHDSIIFYPSILGLVLGVIQVSLYWIYDFPPSPNNQER